MLWCSTGQPRYVDIAEIAPEWRLKIRGRSGSCSKGASDETICIDEAEEGESGCRKAVVAIEAGRTPGERLAGYLLFAAARATPSNSRCCGTVPVLAMLEIAVPGGCSVRTSLETRPRYCETTGYSQETKGRACLSPSLP